MWWTCYRSSDESGIEDKIQISEFSMTSSMTLSPVPEVKESPNHKMSTKSSELVNPNEICREGQTKSTKASAFPKINFFVNSTMSSSSDRNLRIYQDFLQARKIVFFPWIPQCSIHRLKDSPNHKMSTESSELVDQMKLACKARQLLQN